MKVKDKGILYTVVTLVVCSIIVASLLSFPSPSSSSMHSLKQYSILVSMALKAENCLIELSRKALSKVSEELLKEHPLSEHGIEDATLKGICAKLVEDGISCSAEITSTNIRSFTHGPSVMDRLLGISPRNGSIEVVIQGNLHAACPEECYAPSLYKKFTIVLHHPFRYYEAKALAKKATSTFEGKLRNALAQSGLARNTTCNDTQSFHEILRIIAQEVSSEFRCRKDLHATLSVEAWSLMGNQCSVLLSIFVEDLQYSSSAIFKVYPIRGVAFKELILLDLQRVQKQHG